MTTQLFIFNLIEYIYSNLYDIQLIKNWSTFREERKMLKRVFNNLLILLDKAHAYLKLLIQYDLMIF